MWSDYETFSKSGIITDDVMLIDFANQVINGTYPPTNSYLVELLLTDIFGSSVLTSPVPSGSVLMHFRGDGTGLGIGKFAEDGNLLDVDLPTRFRQNAQIDGALALASFANPAAVRIALGIRTVSVQTTLNTNTYTDINITFSPAFPSTPSVVIPTYLLNASQSQSANRVYLCFESRDLRSKSGTWIRMVTNSTTALPVTINVLAIQ